VSILPDDIDGGERGGKPQGCRVMGGNDVSHERNTPGPCDQLGNHPISRVIPRSDPVEG